MKRFIFVLFIMVLFFPARGDASLGINYPTTDVPLALVSYLDPDWHKVALRWNDLEPFDDEFDWSTLDEALEFLNAVWSSSYVVVQIIPDAEWAVGESIGPPYDLDRDTPLEDDPPVGGYSPSLANLTIDLYAHYVESWGNRSICLQFGPDPITDWSRSDSTLVQDVEDYVRC